ncbi:MAG: HAD family hydrolase [Candidatus Hodarchaeota archaeon]
MRPKAILFDLDGTLVDSIRIFPQLIAQEFLDKPKSTQIRKYLIHVGKYYNANNRFTWFRFELLRAIRVDFNISWIRFFSGMIRVLWQFYKWDQKIHPFPEVPQTLRLLKNQGLKLGIVSNGSPYLLKKRFNPYLSLFDILVDSKSLGVRKPSPIPIIYACKKLNIPISKVIFIGDTLVDLLAAKNAGIQIILVKTGVFGLPPFALVNYPPQAIIPAVGKELISLIIKRD